jgi:hypothetical protein
VAWKIKGPLIRVDFDISLLYGQATYVGEVDVQALQLEVGGTIVPSQKYQTAIPRPEVFVEGYRRNLLAIAVKAVLTSNGLPVVRVSMFLPIVTHNWGVVLLCWGVFWAGVARTRKRHRFGYPTKPQIQFSQTITFFT